MNTLIRFSLAALLALIVTSLTHAGDKITYYHNDALGSPVAATNQLGQVIWRETYKPYGERTTKALASANQAVWFTGKPEESALGINYFGARWYHPEAGRFLVIDPAGVSPENIHSFNRYSYANNNPYTYVDPTGGIVETAWDALNIGLGVASFVNNARQGNYGAAAVDAVGVAVDGTAAAFPFIPGGAGSAIKAARGADDVVDAAPKYVPGGRFSKSTKDMAAERAGRTCEYCGIDTAPARKSERGVTPPKNEAQTDHIVSRSSGGTNSPDNAAHSCRECNQKFSNKSKPSPRGKE
jgi:RHS repeat-associated protein